MSLKVKDKLISAVLAAHACTAVYLQYFSVISLRGYAPIAWCVLALMLVIFMVYTQPGVDFRSYVHVAKAELRKVVWPGKQEVISATLAVAFAVVLFSILVSFLDSLLVGLLTKLIG